MRTYPKHVLTGIERHLTEQKVRVKKQLTELAAQDPFSDTDRLSETAASDSEAKEEFNHDRYQAMIGELKQEQAEIDGALTRIKKGTYGVCTRCGKLIDTDRLAAIPTATMCMACGARKK